MQVLSNFMKKLIRTCDEAFVIVAERKFATATNPKMVPRQHIGSDNSIELPEQKRSVRKRVEHDGGVIPDTGFPRDDGMATRRSMQATISDTVQNTGIS